MTNKNFWVPEICYSDDEDEAGMFRNLPFVPVPSEEEMPKFLLIWESRDTGETEPGPDGEDLPITDIELHQYANIGILRERLPLEIFNTVRAALGLQPLGPAAKAGKAISEKVRENVAQREKKLEAKGSSS